MYLHALYRSVAVNGKLFPSYSLRNVRVGDELRRKENNSNKNILFEIIVQQTPQKHRFVLNQNNYYIKSQQKLVTIDLVGALQH